MIGEMKLNYVCSGNIFGSKLQHFPKELRKKLDRQRKEYKESKKKNSGGNERASKRAIKKVKNEVNKLRELVGLMEKEKSHKKKRKVSEANANLMGGRRSCQAE